VGISPLYIERAKGCHVWDLDGNKYIDLVSSLASVTIGYRDKRINQAVREQLKKGVSFSLPGILEAQVAELICELVPSAEMVRFGKNGSDATSAAVRLARAYTGRDHVIVCGYHGWQDWYIGSTTRNKGVPDSVSALTHKFEYNNIESLVKKLQELDGKVAAVIMEPMNTTYPIPGFLEQVKAETHKAGALLIFDETITGFRFASGGAQELFGVTPDLSTFGKGMANGFPLSAVVGRRDIMIEMENIFFSGTFGGELLSLAAAKRVLELHSEDLVCDVLIETGKVLNKKINSQISSTSLDGVLKLSGHETWTFLHWSQCQDFSSEEIRTYFLQESFKEGLLVLGSNNLSLAHAKAIDSVAQRYQIVLEKVSAAITSTSFRRKLKAKPLVPLFKVR
jgi:glutamate-1-semialdehyde 2,1-aminomutase